MEQSAELLWIYELELIGDTVYLVVEIEDSDIQ